MIKSSIDMNNFFIGIHRWFAILFDYFIKAYHFISEDRALEGQLVRLPPETNLDVTIIRNVWWSTRCGVSHYRAYRLIVDYNFVKIHSSNFLQTNIFLTSRRSLRCVFNSIFFYSIGSAGRSWVYLYTPSVLVTCGYSWKHCTFICLYTKRCPQKEEALGHTSW